MNDQPQRDSGEHPEAQQQAAGEPQGTASESTPAGSAQQPGEQSPQQGEQTQQVAQGQQAAQGYQAEQRQQAEHGYQAGQGQQTEHGYQAEQTSAAEQSGWQQAAPTHPEQSAFSGFPAYPSGRPYQHPYGTAQQEPGIGGAPGGHYPYMGQPQNQGWQQPHPPMGAVPVQQQPRDRRSGLVTGALLGALLIGLVGGGVGGYVGYHLGSNGGGASAITSLEQQPPARSTANTQGSVSGVAQKVLPSVAQLQIESTDGSGEGSGIVLSQDGYILTNAHVAQGAEQGRLTAVFNDSRSAQVRVVGSDPSSDLAVVKADITGLTPAEIGRSDDLPVGAPVVAIGSPFGLSGTVTSGIISAKDRPVRAGGESGDQSSVLNALQTDAAINPGNSGGPLVDMDGRVVGINSAIYSPGSAMGQQQGGSVGLGFAIPIDQARRTATELKNTGSATQTTLGVGIVPARRPGALVQTVAPGGPAQGAGMTPGLLITKFDGRFIEDPDALIAAVRSHSPGQRVPVTAMDPNGGGERTFQVVLTGQKI